MFRFLAASANGVRQSMKGARAGLAMAGLAFGLAACAYQPAGNQGAGLGIDNPVERKFTWYSYLDAADIRNSCASGGPDQLRLVYNAQFYDHVRAYDLLGGPNPLMTARARGTSGNLLGLSFDSLEGLFGPWNFRKSQTSLTAAEWAELVELLRKSGYASTEQSGMRLHSQDFYWLVAGCEAGKFHFNAWAERSSATPLTRIQFLDFLLKRDATGLPYKPPRPVPYIEKADGGKGRDSDYRGDFVITVQRDGIGRSGL
ncbi:hypothetical protein A8950_2464 [Dongia mobilis]|uniref:Lipoprotein n=2 Tax=Dongia mobilis TaxID=578943 RepID=A0A4R6WLG3_9PROT|nr:hypothetical protein A8950_2464 [Dongia mobilis]